MNNGKEIEYFLKRVSDGNFFNFYNTMKKNGIDVKNLLSNCEPKTLQKHFKTALNNFAQSVQPMLDDGNNQRREQGLNLTLEFLQQFAEISPDFKKLLIEHNLYKATVQQVMADNALQFQLKALFKRVTDQNIIDQWHNDFTKQLYSSLKSAHEEMHRYLERVKNGNKDPQGKAALDSMSTTTETANKAGVSNGMFDPPRKMGQLLWILFFINYVVPFEKKYYPDLQPVLEEKSGSNPYADLNRQRFGGVNDEVYPVEGGAPSVQPPPGMKI